MPKNGSRHKGTLAVSKEVAKWQERVLYDVRFKEQTSANLFRLDELYMMAMQRFVTIAANSEALVYKIGRDMIETANATNDDIFFLDGEILRTYIGDDSAEWKKKERLDDMFQIFASDFRNCWVFIPYVDFDISVAMDIYFMTQIKRSGARGLVIYAEGANNMVEVLARNIQDPYFFEFPKNRYRRIRRRLEDDEY